jgi:hypothetical protein
MQVSLSHPPSQRLDKRRLRDIHFAEPAHALLALLLQPLALGGDVAASLSSPGYGRPKDGRDKRHGPLVPCAAWWKRRAEG